MNSEARIREARKSEEGANRTRTAWLGLADKLAADGAATSANRLRAAFGLPPVVDEFGQHLVRVRESPYPKTCFAVREPGALAVVNRQYLGVCETLFSMMWSSADVLPACPARCMFVACRRFAAASPGYVTAVTRVIGGVFGHEEASCWRVGAAGC